MTAFWQFLLREVGVNFSNTGKINLSIWKSIKGNDIKSPKTTLTPNLTKNMLVIFRTWKLIRCSLIGEIKNWIILSEYRYDTTVKMIENKID